jgi:uncharacterized protein (TIGR03437 family)
MIGRWRWKIRMKHRTFAFLVLLLALADAARAATTTWAATTYGPYKSTDGGATWQPVKVTVSNGLLQGIPSSVAIAVDPVNPSNVYFLGEATGTSAVFKSTDAGQTWSAALVTGINGTGSNPSSSFWICIDPVAPNNIYISANKTFHSTDSGATWTEMSLDSLGGLTGIAGLATDPKISGVVYAAVTHGKVAKSTDFGATWKALATLATSSPTNGSIFVDPRNSQNLYVSRRFGQGCFASNNQAADCAAFRSVDGGLTWQNVAVPATTRTIDFDRTNGDIYAGGVETGVGTVVLKSSDQGVTWTPVAKGFGGLNDGPAVSVDPGATGNVYALGDSGVGINTQKTTDGGATWKKVTFPSYCVLIGPNCPLSIANFPPEVYMLAYEAPPAPPAVSVATLVSAASGLAGPVAVESIVIATGSHIATGSATADYDQPPTTLAGTTVNVTDSAGVTRSAVLLSVSATQVTYQIPPGTAAGPATVTITAGDGITGAVQVQVAAVAPGLYTLNSAGLVKAYVLRISNGNQFVEDVYDVDPTGAVVARPITISNGDQVYLIAYGTGFRAAGTGGVTVTIGADNPPALYAGPQGVAVGVDQFNILIPPDLAAGGQQVVPLTLTAGGQTANTVNLTVQ